MHKSLVVLTHFVSKDLFVIKPARQAFGRECMLSKVDMVD